MRFLRMATAGMAMTLALAAGLAAQEAKAAPKLDASLLKLGTGTYDWVMGGNSAGTVTATASKEGDVLVLKQSMESQMFTMQGELRYHLPDLAAVSLKQTAEAGGNTFVTTLKLENGKVTGTMALPPEAGGEKTFDVAVPEGTLLGDASVHLSLMPLAVGQSVTFNIFSGQAGTAQPVTFKVTGEEKVTVPAGTFDAYKLEIAEGEQASNMWVTKSLPHELLKRDMVAMPLSVVAKTLP